MSRTATRLAGALAGAAAVIAMAAVPASADPSSVPAKTDFVGVGSDTTQDVLNRLATGWNGRTPAPSQKLASWDATPRNTNITPASGCTSVPRPDGSSAGINALKADTTGCIDFARSSRVNSASEDNLVFIPFANDVLTYAFDAPSSNAIKNLTKAELASIYTCTKLTWSSVRPGSSTAAIKPRLPQAGSGTRSTFLADIAVTEAQITTAKSKAGCQLIDTVQENDPAAVNGDLNTIAPFAKSRYTVLGGSSTGISLSSSNTSWTGGYALNRPVFNVVKEVASSPNQVPTAFRALFGNTGYVCSSAGQTIVRAAGFTSLSQGCGLPIADK